MTIQEIFKQCGQIFNFILENIKKVGILFTKIPELYYSAYASFFGISTDELKKIITTFNEFKSNLKIVVTYYTFTISLCTIALIIIWVIIKYTINKIINRRSHR